MNSKGQLREIVDDEFKEQKDDGESSGPVISSVATETNKQHAS